LARRWPESAQRIGSDGPNEPAVESRDQKPKHASPRHRAKDHVAAREGRQCEWQEDDSAAHRDQAAERERNRGPSHRSQDHAPGAPGRPTNGDRSATDYFGGADVEPPSARTFLTTDPKVKPVRRRNRVPRHATSAKAPVRIQTLSHARVGRPDPAAPVDRPAKSRRCWPACFRGIEEPGCSQDPRPR
jgi:hypothetical protein